MVQQGVLQGDGLVGQVLKGLAVPGVRQTKGGQGQGDAAPAQAGLNQRRAAVCQAGQHLGFLLQAGCVQVHRLLGKPGSTPRGLARKHHLDLLIAFCRTQLL